MLEVLVFVFEFVTHDYKCNSYYHNAIAGKLRAVLLLIF